MTSETYSRSGIPGVTGAVGAHVRHCLDHVYALERGVATREMFEAGTLSKIGSGSPTFFAASMASPRESALAMTCVIP